MRKTCLNMVYELAKRDPRVVFVGSDLGPGVLDELKHEMPERFFMEGVAEQNVVGMAAGLAMEGFIPYVNTIATFITRRCFEQVAVDLCLHNLPVRLIGNGGGLVYAPLGPTHLAIEDIAIMRALPNMTVFAASDADEMTRFMDRSLDIPGPAYIRLGKGGDPVVSRDEMGFEVGQSILLEEPGDVLVISTGVMTGRALDAANIVREDGISCGVLHMHTIKPLDEGAILRLLPKVKLLVTVEEHTIIGGLGSAVADTIIDKHEGPLPTIRRLGIPDAFTEQYGSQDSLLDSLGLQPDGIADTIRHALNTMKAA